MSYQLKTVSDFYAWVKTQDPTSTYNYFSLDDCACARYAKARGISDYDPTGKGWMEIEGLAQAPDDESPLRQTMAGLRRRIEVEHPELVK